MREFHDFADSRNEFVQSGLSDQQRRGRFQNHKIITAYLGADILVARHVGPGFHPAAGFLAGALRIVARRRAEAGPGGAPAGPKA